MARGTPKRAQRKARPGGAFPSEVLARNVKAYRGIRGMQQADVALLMGELGLGWSAGTVGFVERGDRAVSVDEYVGLALCLGVPVGALVDPTGPDGGNNLSLDLGGRDHPRSQLLKPDEARPWARGERRVQYEQGGAYLISPTEGAPGVTYRVAHAVEQAPTKKQKDR